MSLISVSAPGDILSAITAGFGTMTAIAQAVSAIANDQSAGGAKLKGDLAIAVEIPIAIMGKLDTMLGVKVSDVTKPEAPK